MINKYENKKLKLNYEMKGHQKGSVVDVEVDKHGVPIKRYWRDRLKESKMDNCVELVEDTKKGGQ